MMDEKRKTSVSKFLSLVLRHDPGAIGLELADGGWLGVDELIAACAARGNAITRDELDEVVATSDKKRFAFDESGERIRANQGHSVEVALEFEERTPPPVLFHGTPERLVERIMREGIKKMARHHVHLSADTATASKVGERRGRAVVLVVDTERMAADGVSFFVSANGVWLVDEVPPKYIEINEA